MNNELLLPDTLATQIQKRLLQLQATLRKIRETQKGMPQGHLRVAQKGNKRPWFYHYTSPDDLTGKYIRKKDKEFEKALAQKDYNATLIAQLQKEIASLQEYLTQSQNGRAIPKLYESLCPARQILITPVTLTNEQYIAQWKSVPGKDDLLLQTPQPTTQQMENRCVQNQKLLLLMYFAGTAYLIAMNIRLNY